MSNTIYIEHNPFTVETKFEVNGYSPDNISFLETNQTRRLQLWVEHLFPNLYNIFNGDTHLEVIFKGVEADFLDIEEAAQKAEQEGMHINLKHINVEDSISRLAKMQQLMQEAKMSPIFDKKVLQSREVDDNFNEALNKDFDVYVAATMSAGKSTLINAMLGTDLLPAANEATTATIAQITDNDSMPLGQFEGCRFNKNGEEVNRLQIVKLETLKEWNSKPDTKLIKLEGNIIGIKERKNVRLVITDTPGPNNSQDKVHARTTMSYIQDSVRNPLILYILNATQLGTKDDQQVLSEISRIMQEGGKQAKDRFIFVVNKMDAFDPERGENIEAVLGRVRQYLVNNGIENPLIYPVSAQLTNLLRRRDVNPDSLTRSERNQLTAMEDLFTEEPTMDMVQYMPLTSSARRNLRDKKLPAALERSGLPAIESMIDEYIDKYNLPNRVHRAYLALNKAVQISSDEANVTKELKAHLDEIEQVNDQLNVLKANKDRGAKAKAEMEKVINDKDSLYPREAISKLNEYEVHIRKMFNQFQDDFVKDGSSITKKQATRRLNALTEDINFESNRLINQLDAICFESKKITEQKLHQIFNDYVKKLFSDLDLNGKDSLVLKGLKDQVTHLATLTGLGLNEDEIEIRSERVKTGTRTVTERVKVGTRSTSTWWKPWTWGDEENIYENRSREEDVYDTRTEEYVDVDDVWENRESDISRHFNNLVKKAIEVVESDTKAYANRFKDFMTGEFEVKFNQIIKDLQEKMKNKERLQQEIEKAKATLVQIERFNKKLNAVLDL